LQLRVFPYLGWAKIVSGSRDHQTSSYASWPSSSNHLPQSHARGVELANVAILGTEPAEYQRLEDLAVDLDLQYAAAPAHFPMPIPACPALSVLLLPGKTIVVQGGEESCTMETDTADGISWHTDGKCPIALPDSPGPTILGHLSFHQSVPSTGLLR
jgi:hypothetical protein